MDQQGSTPDNNVGGLISHSPQNSADNPAPQAQPSTPQTQEPAPSGDLLGRLQEKIQNGEPAADTPSQTTPQDNPAPQPVPQNQGQQQGDSVDPDLARWASSQNIDLNNPTAEQVQKLAKRLRDTQTALHNRNNNEMQQAAQQSQDDGYVDPVTEVDARLKRFEFFEANPEAKALEPEMVNYALNLYQNGDIDGFNYYRNHWDQLYAMVKASNIAPADTGDLIDQGRQQERENLARAQQAGAPVAAATSSAPAPQLSQDDQIAQMDQAQYNEWRKTHNPFAVR